MQRLGESSTRGGTCGFSSGSQANSLSPDLPNSHFFRDLKAPILHGSSFPQPPHLFVLEEWRLQVLRIAKIA
jgi:hypothetical protein